MVERAWDGDAVLADLITHSVASTPTGRQPLLVDVGELTDVVEGGNGGWLDLETGIAWPQEIIDDGDADDIPDPEEDPDRWLEIGLPGSKDAWQDMADFADSAIAASARPELEQAIHGSGAFKRFQATLNRHPGLRVHWRVHSSERQTGRARAWLADAGYDAITPTRTAT